jgi:hypothetical protein
MAICSGVAFLVGGSPALDRTASGAEPTPVDCLKAHEDSLELKNNHQLRAALEKVVLCSSDSCPAEVRLECVARARELDATIPTILFEVKDAAGADLADVTVKMDGKVLTRQVEGTALSIDPGQHTFTFEAARRPSLQRQLVISEGDKERRERVTFGAVSGPPPVEVAPAPHASRARTFALALGGVGVAAAAVGAIFGGVAISRHHDAEQACPDNPCQSASGVDLWNGARSAGDVSTAAFLVAAAALAGSITLWLLDRSATHRVPAAAVGLGPRDIELAISW